MHRAFGQIGDRAIARVIQRQDALVGLAAIDVARVGDDAEHRGIVERVDRDALEPAPAAVAMAEAVFEAIELGLGARDWRAAAKSFAHRLRIVRVQELGGIAA